MSAAQGAMTASLLAGSQAAGSGETARRSRSQRRTVSGRLSFRVGSSYGAEATCLSESSTGARLCPLRWEVNVYVVCRYNPHPHLFLVMIAITLLDLK